MTRRLLIMADYGAEPVWSANGRVAERLDDVPLSAATKRALREWASRYDELPSAGLRWSADDEADFERTGRELWIRVSAELGSGWRVGYFSEREGRALWGAPTSDTAA